VLLATTTNADTLTAGNSLNTTFAGTISGNGSLNKNGAGTLTLSGLNSYSGATTINGGTVAFGQSSNSNVVSALQPLLWLTFSQVGGSTVTNLGTGGAAMNGTLTGGNASITSGGRFGNALKIGTGAVNTGYVKVNNAVTMLNGATPGSSWTVALWIKTSTSGGTFLYQGDGSWDSGASSFFLTSAQQVNSGSALAGGHIGGVRWGGGWMGGSANVNDGNWHFIAIADNSGAKSFYVDGNVDTNYSASQLWTEASTGNQIWIGGSADTGDGNTPFNGLIDEVLMFNQPLNQPEIQSLMNNFAATNITGVLPQTSAVTVQSGATLDLSGTTQSVGSLAGSGLVTNSSPASATLVLNNSTNATFSGVIADGGIGNQVSLIMSGPAAEFLSGANTYSGLTVISNGTLFVNGSLGNSTVMVNGGTLDGSGIISGPMTVQPGGTLTVGAASNAIGILTISNNLNLAGTTFLKLNASAGTNDLISGLANVQYGGALLVTNLAGAPAAGQSFQIFSAAGYNGTFATFNLPPLGTNLVWNTSALANGTLSVVLGAASPQFGQASLVGGNLVFSGSGGAAGYPYSILSSTNLALPLADWNVIGTGNFDINGNFIFTNIISPQSERQFYDIQIH
jgi:autotransporter-associated beta strand protein